MKAKINEWVRTALIMLGESIKLSEMYFSPLFRKRIPKLHIKRKARSMHGAGFSFRCLGTYFSPSFLAISFGMAFLFTMSDVVL